MSAIGGTWFDDYANRFPKNLTQQAWQSFGVGLVVTGVVAGPVAGIASGILSALATLIHAAITPIFLKYRDSIHPTASCMIRTATAVCLTFLTGSLLNQSVDLFRSLIANLGYEVGCALAKQHLSYDSTRYFWIVNF